MYLVVGTLCLGKLHKKRSVVTRSKNNFLCRVTIATSQLFHNTSLLEKKYGNNATHLVTFAYLSRYLRLSTLN